MSRTLLAPALVAALLVPHGHVAVAHAADVVAVTATFTTPGTHSFTVPPGVTSLRVVAVGAAGGRSFTGEGGRFLGGPAGRGARLGASVPVAAGEVLEVTVGELGETSLAAPARGTGSTEHASGGEGGTPDGGDGGEAPDFISNDDGTPSEAGGGGGGGATSLTAQDGRLLLIAGGGGGGGGTCEDRSGGGAGGDAGEPGRNGVDSSGGLTVGGVGNGKGGGPGTSPDPGPPPTDGAGGGGGSAGGQHTQPGSDGAARRGGTGGAASSRSDALGCAGGGGGGGGLFGGGGGGAGALTVAGPTGAFLAPGGGGGGGGGSSWSSTPPTSVPAPVSEAASVTITYDGAAPTATAPAPQSVTQDDSAVFTTATSGVPTPTVVWQRSRDGGTTWAEVATGGTYTVPSTTVAADDGHLVRAVVTNAVDTVMTAAAALTVAKRGSSTSLTSGPRPASSGETVVVDVTVSGGKVVPAGSVQVYDGGTLLATFGLVSGSGRLTTDALAPGERTLRAVYAGDGGHAGSEASTVQTVQAPVSLAADPPEGRVGEPYRADLLPTGGDGSYTVTVTAGSLPPGVDLSVGGVLSGTPTVSGTSAFTVTATDGRGATSSRDYSLPVRPQPARLAMGPEALPSATVGEPYSAAITASGGTRPYSFAATGLPPGLSLSSAGALTGTPTTAGDTSPTVTVRDAAGTASTRTYDLRVAAAPDPGPGPGSPPDEEPPVVPDEQPGTPDLCDEARANPFEDVPEDGVHRDAVVCLYGLEVVRGTTATTFSPAGELTRGQAAAFVARGIAVVGELAPSDADPYDDVAGSPFAADIRALTAAGVLNGTTATSFEPERVLTRAQLAAVLRRGAELVVDGGLPDGPDAFDDDTGSVHEDDLDAAAAAGVLLGTAPRTASPDEPVRRDQAASALLRLLRLA